MITDDVYGSYQCESCGFVFPEGKLGVQTAVRARPEGAGLRKGDHFDLNLEALYCGDFLIYSYPRSDIDAVFIECWDCMKCAHAYNWAIISVHSNILVDARSIILCEETISNANFIWFEARLFGWIINMGEVRKQANSQE